MLWTVANHDDFDSEFDALPPEVQDELLAVTALLEVYGPMLGRPHADTLAGSKHANMKELRFTALDGVWRVAFAFKPDGSGRPVELRCFLRKTPHVLTETWSYLWQP